MAVIAITGVLGKCELRSSSAPSKKDYGVVKIRG